METVRFWTWFEGRAIMIFQWVRSCVRENQADTEVFDLNNWKME